MDEAKGPAAAGLPWLRGLGEVAFAAVVAVALFAAGSTLTLRLNPAILVCPVPMVLVAIRRGPWMGAGMVAFASAVVAGAQMPGASAPAFVLEIGIPALILGLCLRRNMALEWTVILGAASLFAGLVVVVGARAGGIGPAYRGVVADVSRGLLGWQQFVEGLGPQGEMTGATDVVAALRALASKALPGLVGVLAVLAAAAIAAFSMVLAARTVGTGSPAFTWTLPEGMVWAFIAAAGGALAPWGPWQLIGLNGLLVILALYFLQGLSIAGFFFRRLEFPWYVRMLVVVVALVWPPLTLLAVAGTIAVGLFDVWVAFRRLDVPRSPGPAR